MGLGKTKSYLKYMYERLVLMRELLAENGSIYVHLDWHVGHYVKVMMDEIFGYENMVSEIIWWYRDPSGAIKNAFMWKYDVILFYSKNVDKHIFNLDAVRTPYKEGTIQQAESGTTSFGRVVNVHRKGLKRIDRLLGSRLGLQRRYLP
ncbi:MAG: DNA methyltransferase [Candidatus Pacearchaeota archaeon]|nr:DNA methyltransferase [Candidatus Pacearchaeota archaeon]